MSREHLSKTVTRMEAGAEPPGKVLRRVLDRCSRLMSRTDLIHRLCSKLEFIHIIYFLTEQ